MKLSTVLQSLIFCQAVNRKGENDWLSLRILERKILGYALDFKFFYLLLCKLLRERLSKKSQKAPKRRCSRSRLLGGTRSQMSWKRKWSWVVKRQFWVISCQLWVETCFKRSRTCWNGNGRVSWDVSCEYWVVICESQLTTQPLSCAVCFKKRQTSQNGKGCGFWVVTCEPWVVSWE